MEERERLYKRFCELLRKADNAAYYVFTDFLGLMEISLFEEAKKSYSNVQTLAYGGVEGAERVMLRLGDEEYIGYSEEFPIVCLKIEPKSQKFADKLTHRDFLGSLLSLGIERSTLGDIVIKDNIGYVFVKENIKDYVITSLDKVKHTQVNISECELSADTPLYETKRIKVQASGERIDAVVAKVFSLSRSDAGALFAKGTVFRNGKEVKSPSYTPKKDEIISVRGFGRFIYRGYETTSKKGKLNIEVDLFV